MFRLVFVRWCRALGLRSLFLRQVWPQEKVDVDGLPLAAVVKGLHWWLASLVGVGAVGSRCKKGLAAVVALVTSVVALERCLLQKGESERQLGEEPAVVGCPAGPCLLTDVHFRL